MRPSKVKTHTLVCQCVCVYTRAYLFFNHDNSDEKTNIIINSIYRQEVKCHIRKRWWWCTVWFSVVFPVTFCHGYCKERGNHESWEFSKRGFHALSFVFLSCSMKPWKVCVFKETSERSIQWFSVIETEKKLSDWPLHFYLLIKFILLLCFIFVYISIHQFYTCFYSLLDIFFPIMRWKM